MRGTIVREADGVRHGRLRVTAIRGGDGWLRSRVETAEVDHADVFPSAERGVSLRRVVVEGGLGAHKWADRRLLEQATAELPCGALPLLLDEDGTVLEVSRGSVFSACGDEILTPPLDGRILPGIARHQVLETAGTEEITTRQAPLALDDLLDSDEVFIAGSVRGIEPVRSIDGADLPVGGEISQRIAAGLRRRWLQIPQAEPAAAVASVRPVGRPAR
jgi:para-aminobenzoate synthetase / 4-amino-4-deoxychorismate lyase